MFWTLIVPFAIGLGLAIYYGIKEKTMFAFTLMIAISLGCSVLMYTIGMLFAITINAHDAKYSTELTNINVISLVDTNTTIYFDNFTEENNIVTIEGYYAMPKDIWGIGYIYRDEKLRICIPEGKHFDYEILNNNDKQKVCE